MKSTKQIVILSIVLAVLCCLPLLFAGWQDHRMGEKESNDNTVKEEQEEHIQVPPPPFSEDIFPCSGCHGEMEPNPNRRILEDAHDDIVLKHDEKNRWCLDCHDLKNRDKLHLADGRLIDFSESYRLCGQCHGPKLRDWRAGVHGRRTGLWNGQKKYLLCAHCHNPHTPKFKKMKPEPAPVRPGDLK